MTDRPHKLGYHVPEKQGKSKFTLQATDVIGAIGVLVMIAGFIALLVQQY